MPLTLSPCQQIRKKRSFLPATRSSLNLPPLITYQKLNCCDNDMDINRVFLKLSVLHGKLHHPLKEQLLWCAYEDEGKHDKTSLDTFAANTELARGIYSSPRPDHVSLKQRTLSNKVASSYKSFGVIKQDAPMATIIARWTPNSNSVHHDQQSVIQDLATFGDIESVTPFGRQTVVVIFKEIRSACKAIRAFPPRGSSQNMRCVWYHKFVSRYRRD